MEKAKKERKDEKTERSSRDSLFYLGTKQGRWRGTVKERAKMALWGRYRNNIPNMERS